MAKTQEELKALKEEVKTLTNKLSELTEEELKQVTGGTIIKTIELDKIIGYFRPGYMPDDDHQLAYIKDSYKNPEDIF